jgi:RNA polymerase sigma factor (sigma-70 family)
MPDSGSVAAQYGAVYRFIRRRTRSREDAEDLTQEVALAAIAALGEARLREGEAPLGWLYTVAQRRLIDRVRRESRRTIPASETVRAVEPAYGLSVASSLVASMNELVEGQRQVIVMKLFEGRPFSEIAQRLGVSEEACRARFSRGLATLRERLREKGLEP